MEDIPLTLLLSLHVIMDALKVDLTTGFARLLETGTKKLQHAHKVKKFYPPPFFLLGLHSLALKFVILLKLIQALLL